MLWMWIAVGAVAWLLAAVTVSLVICKAVVLRDERERPRPRDERSPVTSSGQRDRANSA
jgi:hypothetical protein